MWKIIKYKYSTVNTNTVLLKLLYKTDSLYNLNKEFFTRQVVEKEQYFIQQQKLIRLAGEKKRELKPLKTKQ